MNAVGAGAVDHSLSVKEVSKMKAAGPRGEICACLFMAGPVDIRPAIEIVAWQAVWRHDDWTLWRHKCMFQAPELPKCDMANFRKTFNHNRMIADTKFFSGLVRDN